MKTIQLLFLHFLFSNILFGQLPYIEQHLSFDQSEYRGMDVISANDSTLILLGQVNLWNPAFTGIPLYGVPAEG
ncbi:MAG: hypothetical protein KDE26_30335, partial [Bacteroidetes bacterium]|nr:hypothetical protein [Bacteroidota bacterium]